MTLTPIPAIPTTPATNVPSVAKTATERAILHTANSPAPQVSPPSTRPPFTVKDLGRDPSLFA
jgi:hypothetical protein